MSSSKTPNFKLKLTPEQQAMVRKATGKNAAAIELSVQELEHRRRLNPGLCLTVGGVRCSAGAPAGFQ